MIHGTLVDINGLISSVDSNVEFHVDWICFPKEISIA